MTTWCVCVCVCVCVCAARREVFCVACVVHCAPRVAFGVMCFARDGSDTPKSELPSPASPRLTSRIALQTHALREYRKASDRLRSSEGAFEAARMLRLGLGAPRDLVLAKRYYDQSKEFDSDAVFAWLLGMVQLGLGLVNVSPRVVQVAQYVGALVAGAVAVWALRHRPRR
jgi:hypothetical protein